MLGGLYNVTPAAALRLNDNYQTLDSNIGEWTQVANSFNLNVTARMRNGLMVQGGFNTGQSGNDYCGVRRAIPEWTVAPPTTFTQSPTNPWCDTSSGWVTRLTALDGAPGTDCGHGGHIVARGNRAKTGLFVGNRLFIGNSSACGHCRRIRRG